MPLLVRARRGLGYAESDDGMTWRKPAIGATLQSAIALLPRASVFKIRVRQRQNAIRWWGACGTLACAAYRWSHRWSTMDGTARPILSTRMYQNIGFLIIRWASACSTPASAIPARPAGVNRAATTGSRYPRCSCGRRCDPPDWDLLQWLCALAGRRSAPMRLSIAGGLPRGRGASAADRDGHGWSRRRAAWRGSVPNGRDCQRQQIYACAGILPIAICGGGRPISVYRGDTMTWNGEDTSRSGIVVAKVREDGCVLASEGTVSFGRCHSSYKRRRYGLITVRFMVICCEIETTARAEADEAERAMERGVIAGFGMEDCDGLMGDEVNGVLRWRARRI